MKNNTLLDQFNICVITRHEKEAGDILSGYNRYDRDTY